MTPAFLEGQCLLHCNFYCNSVVQHETSDGGDTSSSPFIFQALKKNLS